MKDYYKTLEIKKSASKKEIKAAYRRLAQVFHPDKNSGNNQQFYEISEAYNVLHDERSKLIYDMQIKKQNINLKNLIKDINKSFTKSKKIKLDIELVEGSQNKTIRVKTKSKCKACNGIGGKKAGDCHSCNGTGIGNKTYSKNLKSNVFYCLNCSGRGFILEGICRSCNGKKEVELVEEYKVKIDISKK